MEKIVLTNGISGRQNIMMLHFPYSLPLKELVKQYPGAKGNIKLNAWTVPFTDMQLDFLIKKKLLNFQVELIKTTQIVSV